MMKRTKVTNAQIMEAINGLCNTVNELNDRVTKLEERANNCESRVSGIEIKLDTLLRQSSETGKDIKDIYHLIMERHK